MKEFPYSCCQCGFCCVVETCPVAMSIYNIPKNYPCPSLLYDFEKKVAFCKIASLVGIGQGCCMAARCFKDGIQYDFASLSEEIKKEVAFSLLKTKKGENNG